MAALPQELNPERPARGGSGAPRRLALALGSLLLALVPVAGCASLDMDLDPNVPPPPAPVSQVVAIWTNQVVFTPDPVHGGTKLAGLAGRLYLFGQQMGQPFPGDGAVVVDLYDAATPQTPNGKPAQPREEWRIDKDTLKRLLRKDVIGWGYTVFLPWSTYSPDIKQVRLQLHYDPVGGSPFYAESNTVTLNDPDTMMVPGHIPATPAAGVPATAQALPAAATGALPINSGVRQAMVQVSAPPTPAPASPGQVSAAPISPGQAKSRGF